MGAISTRPTIRGYATAIYCTMVLADTLVSAVRGQRDVERCGDPHQFGQTIATYCRSAGRNRCQREQAIE
jgi:hypothetical protein